MFGYPYTTNQINHYLTNGYDYSYNPYPTIANNNFSLPSTQNTDYFKCSENRVDKKNGNFTRFGIYLASIVGGIFCLKKGIGKTFELITDTGVAIGNGVKGIGQTIAKPFKGRKSK